MSDKRKQWLMIQEQAPDVAEWLTAISKTFGKPVAVHVELLESGEVVDIGVFNGSRNYNQGNRRAN